MILSVCFSRVFISGSRVVPKRFRMIRFYYAYVDVHQDQWHYDDNWMSALHHACQHSSSSWRVSRAACQLIEVVSTNELDFYNTGPALYYTPLLYVCDGCARNGSRVDIARKLIGRGVNMECCDRLGNTPFLLAASGGAVDMLRLLYDSGANKDVVNTYGDGAIQRALGCSSTTRDYLRSIRASEACGYGEKDRVGRGRQGFSQRSRHTLRTSTQHCESVRGSAYYA